jgi:hypothetical protein
MDPGSARIRGGFSDCASARSVLRSTSMRARLGTGALVVLVACGSSSGGGSDSSESGGPSDGGDPSTADDSATAPASSDDGVDSLDTSADDDGSTGAPLPCGEDPSLSANEQVLVDMPADSWTSAPSSDLMTLCAPVEKQFPGIRLVSGCFMIAAAWGGGAWDSTHRKMIVWGGGHADYGGNEVYAFDVASFAWERLTDPTLPPFNEDPLHDGNPVSRHTYSGLQWLPDEERFFAIGGAMSESGNGTNVTWAFDVEAATWTNLAPPEPPPVSYSHSTAVDLANGTVMLRVAQSLWSYDIAGNAWSKLMDFGYPPEWPDFERGGDKSGVVDPTRGIFWSFGSNDHLVYDIAGNALVHTEWVTTGGGVYDNSAELADYPEQWFTTGGGDIISAKAPGVDYDAKADAIVAWNGGAPYSLDLASKTWTVMSGDGAPAMPTGTGTYGRWRYVSAYNVFILVNNLDEDVYFYKHTAGCGD